MTNCAAAVRRRCKKRQIHGELSKKSCSLPKAIERHRRLVGAAAADDEISYFKKN